MRNTGFSNGFRISYLHNIMDSSTSSFINIKMARFYQVYLIRLLPFLI